MSIGVVDCRDIVDGCDIADGRGETSLGAVDCRDTLGGFGFADGFGEIAFDLKRFLWPSNIASTDLIEVACLSSSRT